MRAKISRDYSHLPGSDFTHLGMQVSLPKDDLFHVTLARGSLQLRIAEACAYLETAQLC